MNEMKENDVMIWTIEGVEALYSIINIKDWSYDEKLYNNEMIRFYIVTSLVVILIFNIYNLFYNI